MAGAINIDGVLYFPAADRPDLAPKPSSWRIVVLQRGWVFVGQWHEGEDGTIRLFPAANIRRWGTANGLPQLQVGPTDETVLDTCAYPVHFHPLTVVVALDALESAWAPKLS